MKIKIEHHYKDYQSRPGGLIEEKYIIDTPENIKRFIGDNSHNPRFRDDEELAEIEDFINGKTSYLDGDHTDYFVTVRIDKAMEKITKEYLDKLESTERNYKELEEELKTKYKVIAYYDDVYPVVLLETDSLDEAQTERQEAHKLYNIVSIFDGNEKVETSVRYGLGEDE
jgi:hypothetical protein